MVKKRKYARVILMESLNYWFNGDNYGMLWLKKGQWSLTYQGTGSYVKLSSSSKGCEFRFYYDENFGVSYVPTEFIREHGNSLAKHYFWGPIIQKILEIDGHV